MILKFVSVVIADKKEDVQKKIHLLKQIGNEFDMEISTHKTKTMAFRGREHVRTKIVTGRKSLE